MIIAGPRRRGRVSSGLYCRVQQGGCLFLFLHAIASAVDAADGECKAESNGWRRQAVLKCNAGA